MVTCWLDVTDLPQSGRKIQYVFDLKAMNKELGDVQLTAPLDFQGEAYKFNEEVILKGEISSVLRLSCSRCLEYFSCPFHSEFILEYFPKGQEFLGEEKELEEKDLAASYYTNNRIDLLATVKEQTFLSIPIKPLCFSQCKGLCPQCGCNLNLTNCNCFTEKVDDRLLVLKKLRPNLGD